MSVYVRWTHHSFGEITESRCHDCSRIAVNLLDHRSFGGDEQCGDGGRALQCRAGDLEGVDDAVVEHVAVFAGECVESVAEGQSDLAIGFDFPQRPNVRQLAVAMVNLGVVVPPDHPFAGRSSVRLDECADYTMVVADTSMVIRPHLEKLFARSGGRPSDLIETNSIEMMRHLTRLGGCITFLTPFDIETEVAAGQLAFVPVEEFARETQRLILLGPERNPSALGSVLAEHFRAALG